jgi:hypothetical protein
MEVPICLRPVGVGRLGFVNDGRFFRPYLRTVDGQPAKLDPGVRASRRRPTAGPVGAATGRQAPPAGDGAPVLVAKKGTSVLDGGRAELRSGPWVLARARAWTYGRASAAASFLPGRGLGCTWAPGRSPGVLLSSLSPRRAAARPGRSPGGLVR